MDAAAAADVSPPDPAPPASGDDHTNVAVRISSRSHEPGPAPAAALKRARSPSLEQPPALASAPALRQTHVAEPRAACAAEPCRPDSGRGAPGALGATRHDGRTPALDSCLVPPAIAPPPPCSLPCGEHARRCSDSVPAGAPVAESAPRRVVLSSAAAQLAPPAAPPRAAASSTAGAAPAAIPKQPLPAPDTAAAALTNRGTAGSGSAGAAPRAIQQLASQGPPVAPAAAVALTVQHAAALQSGALPERAQALDLDATRLAQRHDAADLTELVTQRASPHTAGGMCARAPGSAAFGVAGQPRPEMRAPVPPAPHAAGAQRPDPALGHQRQHGDAADCARQPMCTHGGVEQASPLQPRGAASAAQSQQQRARRALQDLPTVSNRDGERCNGQPGAMLRSAALCSRPICRRFCSERRATLHGARCSDMTQDIRTGISQRVPASLREP